MKPLWIFKRRKQRKKQEPPTEFKFEEGMSLGLFLSTFPEKITTVGIRDVETGRYLANPNPTPVQFGFMTAHFPMFREKVETVKESEVRQLKVRRYVVYHNRQEEWELNEECRRILPSIEHLKTPWEEFPLLEVWVENITGPKGDK